MAKAQGIRVHTKFFATIREITGKREQAFQLHPNSSVKGFLKELSDLYGEKLSDYLFDAQGNLRESLSVLVNGQAVNTSNLDAVKLKDGDVVVVLPPVSGGKGFRQSGRWLAPRPT